MSAGSEREKTAAAVAALGALPMPVGPGPQASRPIAYAAKNTDLLLADAAERSRAAEWPWDMWCRICHIRPTSHRTEAEALEAADRHVKLEHAPQAEVHKLMAAGGLAGLDRLRARVAELEATAYGDAEVKLLSPIEQIRHLHACVAAQLSRADTLDRLCRKQRERADAAEARVAELEAERHSTNEALDDAGQALREKEKREAVVAEFVAKRAEYITSIRNCHPDNAHDYDRWQGHAAARRQLAEVLGLPVAWPVEDAASVARSADRLTHLLAPSQALREDEPAEAGQLVEWCTGCNTEHDPDQCGYQPESGGVS